jgi:hypothetical protein
MAQAAPPKGTTWKDTADAGKSEASSKGLPLLIFVVQNNSSCQSTCQAMEDPKIAAILKSFVCVFLSRDYDKAKFQSSYVPWIGPTPQTTHRVPLLIFADSKGNAQQGLRSEGKSMTVADLEKHLNKVLDTVAPERAAQNRQAALAAAKLSENCGTLDESLSEAEANMSSDKLTAYRQELEWLGSVLTSIEIKIKEIKDKKERDKANPLLKDLKKQAAALEKYRGKEKELEPAKAALAKARELAAQIKEIAENNNR